MNNSSEEDLLSESYGEEKYRDSDGVEWIVLSNGWDGYTLAKVNDLKVVWGPISEEEFCKLDPVISVYKS